MSLLMDRHVHGKIDGMSMEMIWWKEVMKGSWQPEMDGDP